jgi:hypothetical protein
MNLKSSFAGDGQRPRHFTLGMGQSGGVIELAGGVLEAQPEQLAAGRKQVLTQVGIGQVTHLFGFHD